MLCSKCGEKQRYEYKQYKSVFCVDCLTIAFAELFESLDRSTEQRDGADGGDGAELCDCGEPFPENGYCKFCGTHARYVPS